MALYSISPVSQRCSGRSSDAGLTHGAPKGTPGFLNFIRHYPLCGSIVPKEILGEEESDLILIVDRYLGYSPLLLFRQFCYAHLLRDVEKLKLEFPDDKQVTVFANELNSKAPNAKVICVFRFGRLLFH